MPEIPEADYLRHRLLRLHGFNRILYPPRKWTEMEECLIEKTSTENVLRVARDILPQTFSDKMAREAEFSLVENHGIEKYAEPGLLKKHVEKTLERFRMQLMMDTIYRSCGYDSPNTPADLLDSAAMSVK